MNSIRHFAMALLLAAGCATHLAAQDAVPQRQAEPAPVILGYMSYDAVVAQMPEYAQAQEQFELLKAKYEAEAQRAEEEFQRKFSEFLQGQKDFPRSIMQKRQTELQQLMEQSVDFRQKAQKLLTEAQADLEGPARKRLNEAIRTVATRMALVCVINTDANAAPFLAPGYTADITSLVMQELGISPAP